MKFLKEKNWIVLVLIIISLSACKDRVREKEVTDPSTVSNRPELGKVTTQLKILDYFPTEDEIPKNTEVYADLNLLIDTSTLNNSSFYISENGKKINLVPLWEQAKRRIFFKYSSFKNGETYKVTVTTDLKSKDHKKLENDFSWEFKIKERTRPPFKNDPDEEESSDQSSGAESRGDGDVPNPDSGTGDDVLDDGSSLPPILNEPSAQEEPEPPIIVPTIPLEVGIYNYPVLTHHNNEFFHTAYFNILNNRLIYAKVKIETKEILVREILKNPEEIDYESKRIKTNHEGIPAIFYLHKDKKQISYAYKDSDGWKYPEWFAIEKTIQEPEMNFDENGMPHLFFLDSDNDFYHIYWNGTSWLSSSIQADWIKFSVTKIKNKFIVFAATKNNEFGYSIIKPNEDPTLLKKLDLPAHSSLKTTKDKIKGEVISIIARPNKKENELYAYFVTKDGKTRYRYHLKYKYNSSNDTFRYCPALAKNKHGVIQWGRDRAVESSNYAKYDKPARGYLNSTVLGEGFIGYQDVTINEIVYNMKSIPYYTQIKRGGNYLQCSAYKHKYNSIKIITMSSAREVTVIAVTDFTDISPISLILEPGQEGVLDDSIAHLIYTEKEDKKHVITHSILNKEDNKWDRYPGIELEFPVGWQKSFLDAEGLLHLVYGTLPLDYKVFYLQETQNPGETDIIFKQEEFEMQETRTIYHNYFLDESGAFYFLITKDEKVIVMEYNDSYREHEQYRQLVQECEEKLKDASIDAGERQRCEEVVRKSKIAMTYYKGFASIRKMDKDGNKEDIKLIQHDGNDFVPDKDGTRFLVDENENYHMLFYNMGELTYIKNKNEVRHNLKPTDKARAKLTSSMVFDRFGNIVISFMDKENGQHYFNYIVINKDGNLEVNDRFEDPSVLTHRLLIDNEGIPYVIVYKAGFSYLSLYEVGEDKLIDRADLALDFIKLKDRTYFNDYSKLKLFDAKFDEDNVLHLAYYSPEGIKYKTFDLAEEEDDIEP